MRNLFDNFLKKFPPNLFKSFSNNYTDEFHIVTISRSTKLRGNVFEQCF